MHLQILQTSLGRMHISVFIIIVISSAQYSRAFAKLLKYFPFFREVSLRKIIKIFFLDNPFRVVGTRTLDFRRALFAFPTTGFSCDMSSFLTIHVCIHTQTHSILYLSPFCFLFHIPRNTPDILNSNSIARFSPRKSLPSRWLCPISPTILRTFLILALLCVFNSNRKTAIRRTAAAQ